VVLVIAIAIGVGVAFGLAAIGFQLWVVRNEGRERGAEPSPGGWSPRITAPTPQVRAAPWKAEVPARQEHEPQYEPEPQYEMENFPLDNW
jgi:hypothetical protein